MARCSRARLAGRVHGRRDRSAPARLLAPKVRPYCASSFPPPPPLPCSVPFSAKLAGSRLTADQLGHVRVHSFRPLIPGLSVLQNRRVRGSHDAWPRSRTPLGIRVLKADDEPLSRISSDNNINQMFKHRNSLSSHTVIGPHTVRQILLLPRRQLGVDLPPFCWRPRTFAPCSVFATLLRHYLRSTPYCGRGDRGMSTRPHRARSFGTPDCVALGCRACHSV